MYEMTKSQKARVAIRSFKTVVDALGLRGHYRPSDRFGQSLAESLLNLSPEIYGSMTDSRVVELKGLEYVIERLPRGIEKCNRIILTEESRFEGTQFEQIVPPRRRRTSYRVGEREMCFVITRGLSEIYDILTHLTFLDIEARKIAARLRDESGNQTVEWTELEKLVRGDQPAAGQRLEQALWNLSIILGRTFQETRDTYEYLERGRQQQSCNEGLFSLIYHLGLRIEEEGLSKENALIIYLTPALMNSIGHHKYGKLWAVAIKEKLFELGLQQRPLHVISANLHSVVNILYGKGALAAAGVEVGAGGLPDMVKQILTAKVDAAAYGAAHGLHLLPDRSGAHVDCQIIDTAAIERDRIHPALKVNDARIAQAAPVIVVMDYAFGAQAFELMENLLYPYWSESQKFELDFQSIAIMGKAGILAGNKGDIMLATAHVFEGTTDNYIVENDLTAADFEGNEIVYVGPMLTVVGTSLQNRDILRRIQRGWKIVGLEMEGGHYQRAINGALIKGNIDRATKIRYAYYASDNPLKSGQTLASGPMGQEGIAPTYRITQILLERILN